MTVPVILVVDDDDAVLDAMQRDVRARYGEQYRMARVGRVDEALAACSQLRGRADRVAVLIAAHRLPDGSGTAFLDQARALHPDAGRILLTAHPDTDSAIVDVNEIGVSRYLVKPWGPPETTLYPALDEVLDDWRCRADLPYLLVRGVMQPVTASIRNDAILQEAAVRACSCYGC